jgi:hypothetical protein
VIIVAGVLGVGLVSAGAALEYSSRRSHAIPVIEADSRPLRVKPDNPGGMQFAGSGESILSGTGATPESLAPPPETPDPTGLRQQEQALRAHDAATTGDKTGGDKTGGDKTGGDKTNGDKAGGDNAADVNKPGAVALSEQPPPKSGASPDDAATTANVTRAPNLPAATTKTAPPVTKLASAAPPAPTHPTAAAAAKPNALTQTSNGRQVQLAAVGSEAAANAEWQRISHLVPDLLGSRHAEVTQATRDSHVFWRVRTGGFADLAAANAFCTELRSKGVNCMVASF